MLEIFCYWDNSPILGNTWRKFFGGPEHHCSGNNDDILHDVLSNQGKTIRGKLEGNRRKEDEGRKRANHVNKEQNQHGFKVST